MLRFTYRAVNLSGQETTGVLEAPDQTGVTDLLRRRNLYPVEVREMGRGALDKNIEVKSRIPAKDMGNFCLQFGTVLQAGISMLRALEIMKGQCDNKKLGVVLSDVYEKIQAGQSLTAAFRLHSERFSDMFINMMETGESSGTLDRTFLKLGESYAKEHSLHQKVRSAMIYPTVLSLVAIAVVIFMLTFVVPTFENLFTQLNADLPGITLVMIGLGNFFRSNIIIVLLSIALIIMVFRLWKRSPSGREKFDKFKITAPVIGKLNTRVLSARFTSALFTLSSAGLSLPRALEVTARAIGNSYVGRLITEMVVEINRGQSLSKKLGEMGVFPPMVVQMIRMGEESGALDDLLNKTADYYEAEAEQALTKMAALLEPLVILVMGGVIMFIILSVMLPVFTMYSYIV